MIRRARLTSTTDVEGQEVLQHVPATTLPRVEDGAGSGNDMPDPTNSMPEFGTTIAQSTESAQDAGHSLVPASHIRPQCRSLSHVFTFTPANMTVPVI